MIEKNVRIITIYYCFFTEVICSAQSKIGLKITKGMTLWCESIFSLGRLFELIIGQKNRTLLRSSRSYRTISRQLYFKLPDFQMKILLISLVVDILTRNRSSKENRAHLTSGAKSGHSENTCFTHYNKVMQNGPF